MGYALNLMKLAVSVALMVPLAIEVTVWLQPTTAEGMACCRLGDLCLAGTSRTLRG